MISLLTNTVLDITFGVLWWVTKSSSYGIYNGVSYIVTNLNDTSIENHLELNEEYEIIQPQTTPEELKNSIIELKQEIIDLKKQLIKN